MRTLRDGRRTSGPWRVTSLGNLLKGSFEAIFAPARPSQTISVVTRFRTFMWSDPHWIRTTTSCRWTLPTKVSKWAIPHFFWLYAWLIWTPYDARIGSKSKYLSCKLPQRLLHITKLVGSYNLGPALVGLQFCSTIDKQPSLFRDHILRDL